MMNPITENLETIQRDSIWTNDISKPSFPPTYFVVASVLSVLFYAFLYRYMSVISETLLFTRHYKKLKNGMQRLEWNSRIVSTIHAVAIVIAGLFVYLNDEQFYYHYNMLHANSAAVLMTGTSIGYFIVDLYYVLRYFPKLGGVAMVVHHIAVALAQITVVVYSQFQLMGVASTATEMTTPFINLLWFLTTLDMKGSSLFAINGLLIWLFWLITRIGFSLFTSIIFYAQWQKLNKTAPFVYWFFLVQLFNLSLLNVMWFTKITRGAIKTLFPPKQRQQQQQRTTTTTDSNNKKDE